MISHEATARNAAKKTFGLVAKNLKHMMFATVPNVEEKTRTQTPSTTQTISSYCGMFGSDSSHRACQRLIV